MKMFMVTEHTRQYLTALEQRQNHVLEEGRVLSGLEQFKTISVKQFVRKGLTLAVVRLLTAKRVRLVGDEENQFVEVVS